MRGALLSTRLRSVARRFDGMPSFRFSALSRVAPAPVLYFSLAVFLKHSFTSDSARELEHRRSPSHIRDVYNVRPLPVQAEKLSGVGRRDLKMNRTERAASASRGQMNDEHIPRADAHIFRDPRIRSVEWRDLAAVNRLEVLCEPLLPAIWLAASLVLAWSGHYIVALTFSFVFFLTGLRLVHNAFHSALGLSGGATSVILWIMSVLMLGSMHAVRFNHLRHHRLALGEGDIEGRSAEMPAWGALLFGPVFPVLLHSTALRYGDRKLRWTVAGELLLSAVWIALVFAVWGNRTLRYHVSAMLVGQCLTAFFAVWTVHHHCDRTHYIARTLRNRVKNWITFNMFLHIEHHLFPRVPTCHLPELSRRIDSVAPELKSKLVF